MTLSAFHIDLDGLFNKLVIKYFYLVYLASKKEREKSTVEEEERERYMQGSIELSAFRRIVFNVLDKYDYTRRKKRKKKNKTSCVCMQEIAL